MVHRLLDERRVAFDAVVCVNDDLAAQAMEMLQARGVRVPEDVSVVGFNDTPVCKVVTPPLTTVPWRMYERGQYAAKIMLALLAGESAPAQVLVPARLTVRQSCGCLDPAVAGEGGASRAAAPGGFQGRTLPFTRHWLLGGLAASLRSNKPSRRASGKRNGVPPFLDALVGELNGESVGGFAVPGRNPAPGHTCRRRDQRLAEGDFRIAQPNPSGVDRRPPGADPRRDCVRHQARVMIGQQHAAIGAGWRSSTPSVCGGSATCWPRRPRVPDLMNVLAEELPQVGIKRCYLALYEAPLEPTEWCDLVLAYDENGRRDLRPEERRVRAQVLATGASAPA